MHFQILIYKINIIVNYLHVLITTIQIHFFILLTHYQFKQVFLPCQTLSIIKSHLLLLEVTNNNSFIHYLINIYFKFFMVYERKRLFSLNFQFFMVNNQRHLPWLYSLNKNFFQIFFIKNSQIFDVPFIRYQIYY